MMALGQVCPYRLVVQDISLSTEAAGTSPGDRVLRKEVDHGFSISLQLILPGLMPERLMGTDCKLAICLRWCKSSSTQEFTDP